MLCTMKELLEDAEKQGKAVGAFSAYSMEMVRGIIRGAEEVQTPVILQMAESRFPYAPYELMAPIMINAAKEAKVKIAVHLDHGLRIETVRKALEYGFTSVMFDGSQKTLEENIYLTKQVVEMASDYGATVEGEIGCIGGNEGMGKLENQYTKPSEAELFARETKIDALAVSIGNTHGNYKMDPKLQFTILDQILDRVKCPLVLHGGTGISKEDFQKAIDHGIRKINVATALLDAQVASARRCLKTEDYISYFIMSNEMTNTIAKNVEMYISIFNNHRE